MRLFLKNILQFSKIDAEHYYKILSHQEKIKYELIKSTLRRKQFLFSRGILREELSKILDDDPVIIPIQNNKNGKPYIAKHNLYFNISHTAQYIFIGIDNNNIGIDIEYGTPRNFDMIATKIFSAEISKKIVDQYDIDKKKVLFYLSWTEYEAKIKLLGSNVFNRDINHLKDIGIITYYFSKLNLFLAIAQHKKYDSIAKNAVVAQLDRAQDS